MGPAGKDGMDGAQWHIRDFVVNSQDWNRVEDDNWYIFEYQFSYPELNQFVYDEGVVIGYLERAVSFGGRPAVSVQNLLPFTVYGYNEIDEYEFSENYSIEFRPNYISFIVKYSDGDIVANKPPTRQFRVVLLW
jgi:hypothetical protein